MEKNIWENMCEETYKLVWLCYVQQEANAKS